MDNRVKVKTHGLIHWNKENALKVTVLTVFFYHGSIKDTAPIHLILNE